jgi:hypothetical protein
LGRVGSVIGSSSVGSFRVSGHFSLGQVRSVIGSSSFGSGRLLGHLVSGHFRFRVVSGQVGLVIESSSVRSFLVLNHIRLDQIRSD